MIEMGLALTKDRIERELVCEGTWYRMSYAVRKDGTPAPAREVMTYLEEGTWTEGELTNMHADEQVDAYAPLLHTMQYFADNGEGPRYETMNGLGGGIFEFKARSARLAFYDTPGDGTHEPKERYVDLESSTCQASPTWHIPDLDREIRLCNGWPKKSRTAVPSDIAFARKVRSEDLSHDRV
ncbi:hypothetical protein [Nocardia sp. alder85J]|uniref:hypothetical protein n=1 Tax=Nocardia sp. alder85J TaxID=2862949 RepID=UPI001CD469F7|nr:hypothetical protein [Nocardia sp. alder85J]MCX4098701.1 hypothetical protein [Nocardia sp. alder85J]